MFRTCTGLIVAASIIGALGTTPAVAQEPLTKDGAFPGFERTERDLGTWDAVLVGRTPSGSPRTARFVEINARGCDGACVRTRLVKQQAPTWDMARQWWWFGTWAEAGAPDWNPNTTETSGTAWIGTTQIGTLDTPTGPKGVMVDPSDPRVDVAYPTPDERVITVYGHTPSGREVRLLRIVYTRRP